MAAHAGMLGATSVLGLLAAALWGGGDFGGSVAVKRLGGTVRSALQVVVTGHSLSLLTLVLLALSLHDALPHGAPAIWPICGGALSGISLVAFYLALADGHMGSAAAVSGLLCAAVPAAVSAFTEGSPGWRKLLGFALAGIAIWLIGSATGGASRRAMTLSVLGGLGFGVYFVALKQGGTAGLLWPAALSRVGSLGTCALLLATTMLLARRTARVEPVPRLSRSTLAWILAGAVMDTCGNLSFIAATRAGRLDIAAVLASIYPAGTILLAAWLLQEKTTPQQKLGMCVALPAIVLITV